MKKESLQKNSLREHLLKIRDSLTEKERLQKDKKIKDRFFSLPEYKKANCVLFYVAFRSEVETREMIKGALNSGKRVFIPVVEKKRNGLLLSELKDYDSELIPGYCGILEHPWKFLRPRMLLDVDLAILPGIGFDTNGTRLGYGGGYYDRLLKEIHRDLYLVALAYELQIVDYIPAESHDVKIDKIITEERTIEVSK